MRSYITKLPTVWLGPMHCKILLWGQCDLIGMMVNLGDCPSNGSGFLAKPTLVRIIGASGMFQIL